MQIVLLRSIKGPLVAQIASLSELNAALVPRCSIQRNPFTQTLTSCLRNVAGTAWKDVAVCQIRRGREPEACSVLQPMCFLVLQPFVSSKDTPGDERQPWGCRRHYIRCLAKNSTGSWVLNYYKGVVLGQVGAGDNSPLFWLVANKRSWVFALHILAST